MLWHKKHSRAEKFISVTTWTTDRKKWTKNKIWIGFGFWSYKLSNFTATVKPLAWIILYFVSWYDQSRLRVLVRRWIKQSGVTELINSAGNWLQSLVSLVLWLLLKHSWWLYQLNCWICGAASNWENMEFMWYIIRRASCHQVRQATGWSLGPKHFKAYYFLSETYSICYMLSLSMQAVYKEKNN